MTSELRVDLDTMARTVEAFERLRKEFVECVDVLDGNLRLHLAEWDGDARHAYDVAHRDWTEAAADMADQIAYLRHWLTVGHRNYSGALDAAMRTWQSE
ncbi:WXG100 family type VII secretion target [Actinomadura napierensis]|uniref:WXG100 family type VII secretion target n=1 Tax=Actinomadura napierensis TaxID=267854 RepID=A0ABN2ZYZ4_9ACTN